MFSLQYEEEHELDLPVRHKEEPANLQSEKRPMLNDESIECLESMFKTVRYPSDSVIEYLADDLVVPMSTIKAWFRRKRGEGRKARRSVDGQLMNVDYEPRCGLAGLNFMPKITPNSSDQNSAGVPDAGLCEMQKQMDGLNFEDKEDKATHGFSNQKDENALYIQDILGSLIKFCPVVSKDSHKEEPVNAQTLQTLPGNDSDTNMHIFTKSHST